MQEDGSAAVQRLLRRDVVAASRLSEVEIASALARRVREGGISADQRARAIARLNRDLVSWVVVELTPTLVRAAQSLLATHHLRSGDALQLASCLYLQQETGVRVPLAAFDERLNAAARAEGLTVVSIPS